MVRWYISIVVFVVLSVHLLTQLKMNLLSHSPNENSMVTIRMRVRNMNTSRLKIINTTAPTNILNILLLVYGLKPGLDEYVTSIRALEHYRQHFAAMLYVSPYDTCRHSAFNSVPCIDCFEGTRFSYKCIIHVALSFEEMFASDLKGFLHIHADFWLTPKFIDLGNSLLMHHPGAHWLPSHESQTNYCAELQDTTLPDAGWWWDNSACGGQERCRVNRNGNWPPQNAAVQRAQALHSKKSRAGILSLKYNPALGMWADLYFIPKESYIQFEAAACSLEKTRVMNEIAVPMAMLASCNQSNGRILKLGCWGSCCNSLEDSLVLSREYCGHRLRLNNAEQVAALEEAWVSRLHN